MQEADLLHKDILSSSDIRQNINCSSDISTCTIRRSEQTISNQRAFNYVIQC